MAKIAGKFEDALRYGGYSESSPKVSTDHLASRSECAQSPKTSINMLIHHDTS